MGRTLICKQCGSEFTFEQGEQEMYLKMGFNSAPQRCKRCRGAEKALMAAVRPEKEMFTAFCDQCGKETQLPFKPKGDKPVYCKACFDAKNKK